jgi:Sulfatase
MSIRPTVIRISKLSSIDRSSLSLSIGGYPKFVDQGFNENYLPVWLQQAGYNTYYTGKLFNVHTVTNYDSPEPAGFTGSVLFFSQIKQKSMS